MDNPNKYDPLDPAVNAASAVDGASLIKAFLVDMAPGERTFTEGLSAGHTPLRQTLLKALFEVSLAKSEISLERDSLRTAFQHLAEMRSMAESLQDAIQRHFGFHQIGSSDADASVDLECFMLHDTEPFEARLPNGKIVTVPDHVHEKLYEQGVVSHLTVIYPRADHYGVPEEATYKGGLRWLWDMGFRVCPDLVVSPTDSGDDGIARATIRIHIGSDLLKEIARPSD